MKRVLSFFLPSPLPTFFSLAPSPTAFWGRRELAYYWQQEGLPIRGGWRKRKKREGQLWSGEGGGILLQDVEEREGSKEVGEGGASPFVAREREAIWREERREEESHLTLQDAMWKGRRGSFLRRRALFSFLGLRPGCCRRRLACMSTRQQLFY